MLIGSLLDDILFCFWGVQQPFQVGFGSQDLISLFNQRMGSLQVPGIRIKY